MWGGKTITGQELVTFVKDNAIPVVWGSEQICRGASCSLLYIRDGKYVYEDDQHGVDPIYINPSVKEQKVGRAARLLRELSHEIFHRTPWLFLKRAVLRLPGRYDKMNMI